MKKINKTAADKVFDMVDKLDSKLSNKIIIDSLSYAAPLFFPPIHQTMQMVRTRKELKEICCHED